MPTVEVIPKLPKGPISAPTLPVEFLREFVEYMKERERQETARKLVEVKLEELKVLKKELKRSYKLKKRALEAFLDKLEGAEGKELELVLEAVLRLCGA